MTRCRTETISRVDRADAAFNAAPATTSNTIKSGNNAILKCNMIASSLPAALKLFKQGLPLPVMWREE